MDTEKQKKEKKTPRIIAWLKVYNPESRQSGSLECGSVDYPYLLLVLALLAFGLVMVYSSSSIYSIQRHGPASTYFLRSHLIYLVAGLILTFPFVFYAQPWFWKLFTVILFVVTVLLLMAVLVIGQSFGGAKRWLNLGIVTIQPSELAKTAVVLVLSLYMSHYAGKIAKGNNWKTRFRYGVLMPGILLGVILGLIVLEKHLSGLIIIGIIGVVVMLLGGSDWRWILGAALLLAAGAILVLSVSEYAQVRVDTWIHLDQADPLGKAWQSLQGLYAISSGGLRGTGLGASQLKFGYVSQPQNDFIFTIICEELGFFGAAAVLLLFAALVWRGFVIARHAPDRFTSMVAYGLSIKVAVQVLLNVAVVTNLIPNTGISLPFFSSGGTALIMQIFEAGILLSISRYRRVEEKEEEEPEPVQAPGV